MKIIVLGSQGFIGQNLIKSLNQTKHKIFASGKGKLDLRNYSRVKAYFKKIKPDAIINCAAHVGSVHYVTKYAADIIYDNVQISLNIYRAATEICPKARIINPISNCAYPGDIGFQREEDWLNGPVHESVFAYGNYKRTLYYIAYSYAKQYGIRSVNLLIPGIYGPYDHTDPNRTHALNGMIIRMTKAQKKGDKKFEIWGTGKPIREWIYVDDVVKLFTKGLTLKNDLLYPVNLGQGKGYSIKETALIISKLLNYKGKLVFNTRYQDGAPKKVLSSTRFKKNFPGYHFTNFTLGVKRAITYYKTILG